MTPALALYSDESGGSGECWRALAAVSGPAPALDGLERELAGHARRHGVSDLKWSRVRTRRPRLEACRDFFHSARLAVERRDLCLDVLVWRARPPLRRPAWRQERGEWEGMYARLLRTAARRWEPGLWSFFPDQRTGLNWAGVLKKVNRSRRFQYSGFRPLPSAENHLVQLADLVAGMARFSSARRPEGGGLIPATQNRLELAREFGGLARITTLAPAASRGRKAGT